MYIASNTHNVVFFGPRDNPKAIRWWADAGLIHYEDSRDNSYTSMSIKTFLERLNSINEMLGNGLRSNNQNFVHNDELQRQMRFVEQGVDLAKLAKQQAAKLRDDIKEHKSLTRIIPASFDF